MYFGKIDFFKKNNIVRNFLFCEYGENSKMRKSIYKKGIKHLLMIKLLI